MYAYVIVPLSQIIATPAVADDDVAAGVVVDWVILVNDWRRSRQILNYDY